MNVQEPVKYLLPAQSAEGPSIMTGGGNHTRARDINAFCITLYNEPFAALCATVGSIALSQDSEESGFPLPRAVICVVADGAERLSPDIRQAFATGGVLQDDPRIVEGVELHSSEHSAAELLLLFGLGAAGATVSLHRRFRILFCLKDRNRGKLHSHEVFFSMACPEIDPTFCYQLDAGSVLAPDTIAILTDRLNDDPMIGALAPRVTTPVPGAFCGMLEAWQYHDFSLRQAVLMPLEGDLELLGCVPGQASVFRWTALKSPSDADGRPGRQSPVWAYLFGIAADSPFRHLMYLSEDRVVGTAMVLDSAESWKLKFAARAGAITDACETLRELLLQRRRWTNSAMLCRLWLLGRWSEILTHINRPAVMKAKQSTSVIIQLMLGLREFSAPAQLAAVLILLYQIGSGVPGQLPWYLSIGFFGVVAVEMCVHAFSLTTKSAQWRGAANRVGASISWVSASLWVSAIVLGLPLKAIAIVLGSAFLVVACMVLILPRRGLPILLRTQFSPVQNLVLSNVILVYSLWHMHDSSWGTKGLTRHESSSFVARNLHRFKLAVLGVFVALNAWLIHATATAPGIFYSDLNPLLEFTCVIEFLIVTVTLTRLIQLRLSPRTSTVAVQPKRESATE